MSWRRPQRARRGARPDQPPRPHVRRAGGARGPHDRGGRVPPAARLVGGLGRPAPRAARPDGRRADRHAALRRQRGRMGALRVDVRPGRRRDHGPRTAGPRRAVPAPRRRPSRLARRSGDRRTRPGAAAHPRVRRRTARRRRLRRRARRPPGPRRPARLGPGDPDPSGVLRVDRGLPRRGRTPQARGRAARGARRTPGRRSAAPRPGLLPDTTAGRAVRRPVLRRPPGTAPRRGGRPAGRADRAPPGGPVPPSRRRGVGPHRRRHARRDRQRRGVRARQPGRGVAAGSAVRPDPARAPAGCRRKTGQTRTQPRAGVRAARFCATRREFVPNRRVAGVRPRPRPNHHARTNTGAKRDKLGPSCSKRIVPGLRRWFGR